MFDNIAIAFGLVATLPSLAALLVGVTVGIVIGAIPGMTTTMGVALALPFTFGLSPVTGILLLLGVYKGGLFGGSLTAILLKTPGTPAASCTVLDGYPLARQGQARRAMEMALAASCFADIVSNLALILFAGWLATFALAFGPPELFTLILFALTIVAGVSGDQLLKGFVAAGFGLLAATIGLDLIYGTDRFVFGSTELMAGLNLIPVLIGLFALPEIFNYYFHAKAKEEAPSQVGASRLTWSDFRTSFRTILRGSLIGTVLGAVPGLGAAPSAFLSYSEARRTSPRGANFGKGEIEGVAAAEAGNSGVAGSTMIPLLALGVPGDVITAVILGAFMFHGLRPGPLLFQQNIDLIYALFMGIIIGSAMLFVVGRLSIRFVARVTEIPNRYLFPVVLVLCVYGAYATNNNLFDVLVMLIMGVIGLGMARLGVPAAPFIIAFILGPLLEDNFRQALLIGQGSLEIFMRGPICWLFLALTVGSLVLTARQNLGRRGTPPVAPN